MVSIIPAGRTSRASTLFRANLQRAIGELTGFVIKVSGTSRTDAGVSALGQVVNLIINRRCRLKILSRHSITDCRAISSVFEASEVPLDFDASSSAQKANCIDIKFSPAKTPMPCRTATAGIGRASLMSAAMDAAAKMLVGTHDFKSFAAAADKRETSVRTVTRCDVTQEDKWVYIDIEANRFLYNMVRNIVGTLVEIGRGRWKPEKMKEILAAVRPHEPPAQPLRRKAFA